MGLNWWLVVVKQWSRLGCRQFLDSASDVAGISERLLERLGNHFGGVAVSPLKSGPCQVLVADGRALKARHQRRTTCR